MRAPLIETIVRKSELFNRRIREYGFGKVAICEFVNSFVDNFELRGNLGSFGGIAAERVDQALIRAAENPERKAA